MKTPDVARALKRLACPVLIVLGTTSLSSCGGGGGLFQVPITSGNAAEIASAAFGAFGFALDMAEFFESFADVIADGSGSSSEPCDSGGTVDTVVNDVAPLNQVSAGDSASVAFSSCVFDFGGDLATFQGGLSIAVSQATIGPPPQASATLQLSFQNLSVQVAGQTLTISGALTLQTVTDAAGVVQTIVTGTSVRVVGQTVNGPVEVDLRDFRIERTTDPSTGEYSFTARGTIVDTTIGGSVAFETIDPFLGTDPDDPDEGQMVVSGGENSTLTITAVDSSTAHLDIDVDGDGTPDSSLDVDWSEIR